LGSGKTAFVKGLGKDLGCDPEEIVSPSFSLANVYRGKGEISLNHLDLYRLGKDGDPESSALEFMEAGLDEYLSGPALIEWPERLPLSLYPAASISVSIEPRKTPPPMGDKAKGISKDVSKEIPNPKDSGPDEEDSGRLLSFRLTFDPEPLKTALKERGLLFGP
jgi:tRNA threonylcarbamoyl adenosine modification protein YjeE